MEDQCTTSGLEAKDAAGDDRGSSADEDASSTVNNPNSSRTNNNAGQLQQELPFLVTHWLANYGRSGSSNSNGSSTNESNIMTTSNSCDAGDTTTTNSLHEMQQREREEALSTIRRATSELASAFSVLGAYGSTIQVRRRESGEKESFLVTADA